MKSVIKSRIVGNSVVVTMPNGEDNVYYSVIKTSGGSYIYTPVIRRTVKPSGRV